MARMGIVRDSDGAFRQVSASLEELRSQDEPYWPAVAVVTVGSYELVVNRDDDGRPT
jgi:hypothetical protein